jgi:hypothetical protein
MIELITVHIVIRTIGHVGGPYQDGCCVDKCRKTKLKQTKPIIQCLRYQNMVAAA